MINLISLFTSEDTFVRGDLKIAGYTLLGLTMAELFRRLLHLDIATMILFLAVVTLAAIIHDFIFHRQKRPTT